MYPAHTKCLMNSCWVLYAHTQKLKQKTKEQVSPNILITLWLAQSTSMPFSRHWGRERAKAVQGEKFLFSVTINTYPLSQEAFHRTLSSGHRPWGHSLVLGSAAGPLCAVTVCPLGTSPAEGIRVWLLPGTHHCPRLSFEGPSSSRAR